MADRNPIWGDQQQHTRASQVVAESVGRRCWLHAAACVLPGAVVPAATFVPVARNRRMPDRHGHGRWISAQTRGAACAAARLLAVCLCWNRFLCSAVAGRIRHSGEKTIV